MRVTGLIRVLALICTLVATWLFLRSYHKFNSRNIRLPRWLGMATQESQQRKEQTSQIRLPPKSLTPQDWCVHSPGVPKTKCGLSKPCPDNFFAFKICSGAANVVGPSICFENEIIMSPVKNNVGRGLNIVLVNGTTGQVLKKSSFDMYSGDANLLEKFLTEIPEGTLVLVASYDDPGTKMNDQIRKVFSNLGSSYAKQLGFRDSWVFLGAKDLKNKSPFEQYLKNSPDTNKYEGWPELLELEGCVPRKIF